MNDRNTLTAETAPDRTDLTESMESTNCTSIYYRIAYVSVRTHNAIRKTELYA